MTILFDARWVGDHGIGRFARELSERLPPMHSVGQFPLLHPLEPLWLSYAARFKNHSVYFSPGFNPPLFSKQPYIFMIYDLIHLDIPSESSVGKKLYYGLFLKARARKAFKIITDSHHAKGRIVEWANLRPEQVVVAHCGVSERFTPEGRVFAGESPYVLYVGNQKPHKNLPRLLEAFSQLEDRIVSLFICGKAATETEALVRQHGLEGRVRFLGNLSDDDLAAYYRGAVCLAFPSLYEGFGLPPLEAMACGTPVLTSNTTSLPEVVGGAALLVNPRSVEDIRQGLDRLISDPTLRADLRTRGLERAKLFSWDKATRIVQSVLDEAQKAAQNAPIAQGER